MDDKYVKLYDTLLITLTDLVSAVISMSLAMYIRHGHIFGTTRNFRDLDMLFHVIGVSLLVSVCFDFNRHFFRRSRIETLFAAIKQQVCLALTMVLWLYLIHREPPLSRLVFIYFFLIGFCLSFLLHIALREFMVRVVGRGSAANRLLILATSTRIMEALDNILPYNEWFRIVSGIALMDEITPEGEEFAAGRTLTADGKEVPIVCNGSDFINYALHNEVDEVFILDDIHKDSDRFIRWIRALEEMGVRVNLNIDLFDLDVQGKKDLGRIGKYAVVTISRNYYSPRQAFAKRLLDIAGALAGCLILAVLSVFIVPAIKLDSPGPALFKQQRVGKNGRVFTLYKFRSMYVNADEIKAELMAQNEMKGPMFKMENDPRITRVGRFLRRTSLDEFPQFINILKGDMSLVGTRPPTVDEYKSYEIRHKCRLSMTPGLTGMWQVAGRSGIKDFDEVVALDMSYIDNWKLSKDIMILLKTVKVVLKGEGAE